MRSVFFVFFVFLFFSSETALFASDKTLLQGKVKDESGVQISDAQVKVVSSSRKSEQTTFTNIQGEFFLEVEPGTYNISIEKPGFDKFEISELEISAGEARNLNITLYSVLFVTEQIDVEGTFRQAQEDLRTSVINISPRDVKVLPGAVEDVLRSLVSQPGVTTPNDFSSQLVIRGSGPDQNLIIMDDVEVFNPYRLYGLVSMFNPETLSDITLITGGFPSKYGDRLSAVLDVSNREGRIDKDFAVTTNVNIANANIITEGRNPFNMKGSWIVSTRRTYYDLIIGPFAKKAGLITEDSAFPSFQDLQFRLMFGPFSKHKFFLNGIFSKDAVDIVSGTERPRPDSVNVNDVTNNNILSASWHYIPNEDFISRTTLSWYDNSGVNDFEGDILDPLIDREGLSPAQTDSLKQIGALLGLEFDSRYIFRKYSLTNRSVLLNTKTKNSFEFGAGIDIVKTDLTYALNLDEQFKALLQSLPNAQALLEDFNIEGNNNYRGHLYAQARFNIANKFYYQPSLRADYYSYHGNLYLSPRLNLGYALDPLTTIRSSVGLYYQSPGYEKMRDGQTFYDLTGTVGKDLKPEKSVHFVLGIDRWVNDEWQIKAEGYYKNFSDLVVQQKLTGYRYRFTLADPLNTNPSYVSNPNNWIRSETKLPYDSLTTVPVNEGTGKAVGLEFTLEKNYKNPDTKFHGWLNYSFSVSERQRDGIVQPYRFEQRHIFNIVMNYRFNSWLELGARWSYATNFPISEPLGIQPRVVNDSIVVNPFSNTVIFNLDFGEEADKFKSRKPDYHRLDVRLSAYTKFWNTDWTFYLDVMNVYNRTNVIGYDYFLTSDYKIDRNVVGMIPILPTIGFNARF